MDFTSLNEVTNTIISVIQTAVDPTLTVRVMPEILRNEQLGVGFYLYHVQENNHFKNYPALGKDGNPIAHTPMSLNLHYQLSANWKEDDIEDALEEQILMSSAMKVLHDNAVITTSATGKDINLKITLQSLTPSESVQYWAAAESPVRLSAYYEVSVVFLEPERPRSYAGRVLSYGNFIFVHGAPQVTSSQSVISYIIPGDPVPKEVLIQPAQSFAGNIVSFFGSGFNAGIPSVLLANPLLWAGSKAADPAWLVTMVAENQIDMTVQSINAGDDIIPGLYSAQVNLFEQKTLPNGSIKDFNHTSNVFPFSVMPTISAINPLVAATNFTVTGQLFQHANISNDEVQVYIRDVKLTFNNISPLLAGQFNITSPTTIALIVPATIHGINIPLRILIKGVESPPNWIAIP
jgi:Pvc16 N-terminal domain